MMKSVSFLSGDFKYRLEKIQYLENGNHIFRLYTESHASNEEVLIFEGVLYSLLQHHFPVHFGAAIGSILETHFGATVFDFTIERVSDDSLTRSY